MRNVALAVALLAGCTRALPIDGGDGGAGGGCAAHKDAATCAADARCIALGCPQCDGTQSFIGCYDKNGPLPGIGCPGLACASCHALDEPSCRAAASRGCVTGTCCGSFTGCFDPGEPPPACAADCANICAGLDEATCGAQPGCRVDRCPGCGPGSTYFAGCSDSGGPPSPCVTPFCPAMPCDQLTAADACAARSDCHEVFQPGACGCAGCCCTIFARCADGGKADCKGPAFCNSAPPDCGDPACGGMYAVAYANSCYEGCVLASACAP
ncbi:MAG TPA: hypothetical protein VFF06_20815 [Polyangia bacterium]|nr:hypothetical protein [Polyangia bacterium]